MIGWTLIISGVSIMLFIGLVFVGLMVSELIARGYWWGGAGLIGAVIFCFGIVTMFIRDAMQ